MKKIIIFILLFSSFYNLKAMLTSFVESSNVTTNRFLSKYANGACSSSSSGASGSDCGNDFVSDAINLNFVDYFKTFGSYYMYNDFSTYIDAMSQALNNTAIPAPNHTFNDSVDSSFSDLRSQVTSSWGNSADSNYDDSSTSDLVDHTLTSVDSSTDPTSYPAVGIYQIELSASPSLQETVLPNVQPASGETKIVARLRYNGGATYSEDTNTGIYLLSQDAICLKESDSFIITISSDQDDTGTATATSSSGDTIASAVLSDYFSYNDTTSDSFPAYSNAVNSPRRIRLSKV